jgi:hypothetical protein
METSALPSIIALGAAIGCWLLILAGHPVWALGAAVVGMLLGFTGIMTGATLRAPTSIASLLAVLISLFGIGVIGIMFTRIFA